MPSDVFQLIDSLKREAQDDRSLRQILGIEKWVGNRACGTLQWATGVGKTRAAMIAIRLARRDDPARKIVIVVPRIMLKHQWEKLLIAQGLQENTEVYVINSLIKLPVIECALLILDEIHRYAAKTFAKVFDVIRQAEKFILGLTAELKRTDGKHVILRQHAPIVDEISILEALRKGYVARYREYNLGIRMTEEAKIQYQTLEDGYNYFMDKFGRDFHIVKECVKGTYPKLVRNQYMEPYIVEYARELGWRGNSAYVAQQNIDHNRTCPRGQRVSVWGNDEHPYSPKRLYIWALQALRYIRKIRQFVCEYPEKIDIAEQIMRAIPGKTISFGEITAPAEELHRRMQDVAVMYHSKMKAKAKEESLLKIADDPSVKAIITAKALDEGADFPELKLGVTLSRSSSGTQYLQRLGRVVRTFMFVDGEKIAIMVNLYVMETKDEIWLHQSQRSTRGSQRKIKSVEELLRIETLAA